jgi:hypothetical protein
LAASRLLKAFTDSGELGLGGMQRYFTHQHSQTRQTWAQRPGATL